MKPHNGLGRQIVLSMVAATTGALIVGIFVLYLFYGFVLALAPEWLPEDHLFPSGIEWLVILSVITLGAALAGLTAIRLAQRIVAPLDSVAAGARRIADGDLSARAEPGDRSLGEAAVLVDDFNLMAANLEKASKDISNWNAVIAHELRTPVTILTGRLQGLADGVFQPDPTLFRSLLTQVEGLGRMVEDLRTVTLVDGGHLDLMLRHVPLSEELRSVAKLMEPALQDAGFELILNLEDGDCLVDAGRIRQALLALLENARKHADPCALRVDLCLTEDKVEIAVTDKGPGMPPEFVPEAFKPFRKLGHGNDRQRGSGLGLAVVDGIAKAHGGNLTYREQNGGGRFVIFIPRR